jgi:1-acyl-sn-glycerol-3-phosphate acyltransferase
MLVENPVINVFLIIFIAVISCLLLYLAVLLLTFVFLLLLTLTVRKNKKYKNFSRFYYNLYITICRFICFVCRVKIHVSGLEKLPTDKCFLLVSNHRSNFDNIIQGIVLRKTPIAYISKKENFKIPFAGRLVNRCLFISIDRGHMKSALESIHQATEYVSTGLMSVGVFPEGKRSKNCELLPFKPGCFKIAEKGKCPLVISTVRGTQKIHKNVPFKKTHVYIDFLEVLPSEVTSSTKTVELCRISAEKVAAFLADKKES